MKFPFFALLLFPVLIHAETPHIILVMADDQGWGQTGYRNHPDLKTPNIDEMAENGLRFDRFYAGASNCSPTRATVLTGRTNDRTGVENHGYPLRLQEKTIALGLKNAGYATGHFGKWHLNGLRGPGVPVLKSDGHHPGKFGFDHWLTVTNFFDMDPLMSRMGDFVEFEGDSSEVSVEQALDWIGEKASNGPTFTVIWYGSPHSPMLASDEDRAPFAHLPEDTQHHLGELVAMDRSIGTLRSGLRKLGIAENTLVWYCSDNGGLKPYGSETVGGLRGWKNLMYEGGLRVPAVIEWPAKITEGRITDFPAGTVDIFPTLAEIAALPESAHLTPQDGISLLPLLEDRQTTSREKALPFRHDGRGVLIEPQYKFVRNKEGDQLFDLLADPNETTDLAKSKPGELARLTKAYEEWNATVDASVAGDDYEGGLDKSTDPGRRYWHEDPDYELYLEDFWKRPEFSKWQKKYQTWKKKQPSAN